MTKKNQHLSFIIDKIEAKMKKENCRLLDTDIVRAINRTSYDVIGNEIVNVYVDTKDLVKF